MYNNIFDTLKDKNICLYGARKFGKIALDKLFKMGISISSFIDDRKELHYQCINGIQVIPLEEAIEKYKKDIVIIVSNYYLNSILKRCDGAKIDLDQFLFLEEILIEDLEIKNVKLHENEIRNIYSNLADFKSKYLYKTLFHARLEKKIESLALIKEEIQYFPTEIFSYTENEVLVDAGAYIGDTINSFDKFLNSIVGGGGIKRVYAFEPDYQNYKKLQKNINYDKRVTAFDKGLYSENTMLSFKQGEGGASFITKNSETLISVCTLDSIQFEEPPTLIKMDIEGSELQAIIGAEDTIKKYKPKLAICIYHKQEDLWEIPTLIKQLVPEYKFYIRNYANWLDEIVLYATI